jgi:hypothetical protein
MFSSASSRRSSGSESPTTLLGSPSIRSTKAPPRPSIVKMVSRVQHAGPPAHGLPPLDGLPGVARLAEDLPVEGQHGIAPQNQHSRISLHPGRHRPRLHPGKGQTQRVRVLGLHDRLVDPADQHINIDARSFQKGPPSGRGRGKNQPVRDIGLHNHSRYKPRHPAEASPAACPPTSAAAVAEQERRPAHPQALGRRSPRQPPAG